MSHDNDHHFNNPNNADHQSYGHSNAHGNYGTAFLDSHRGLSQWAVRRAGDLDQVTDTRPASSSHEAQHDALSGRSTDGSYHH